MWVGFSWKWLLSVSQAISWVLQSRLGSSTSRWHTHMADKLVLAVGFKPSRSVHQGPWVLLHRPLYGLLQHGSWVPRTSISREQSRSAWHFYKLHSEVTYHPFCHSLLFETVTKFMGEKTWTPFNGRGARSHCKKSKWGRRYVVSIFGKYGLPKLV